MKRVCKKDGFVAAREGDWPFRWVPYLPGLQLNNKYLYYLVIGKDVGPHPHEHPDNAPFDEQKHRSGSLVHRWAREAGFDPHKIVKGAKVTLYATPHDREFYADNMIGRLKEAGHGDKFLELGATREEVEIMARDWQRWRDDVDGWGAILQCETICWI
jgi:hypothetical protein